VKATKRK